MAQLARRAHEHPLFGLLARIAVSKVDPAAPRHANALAAARFVRRAIRYVQLHPDSLVEGPALFRLGAGDCADSAPAVAALLLRMSYDPSQVGFVLGTRSNGTGHVWTALRTREHGTLHLDASTRLVHPGVTDPSPIGQFDAVRFYPLSRLL